MTWWQRSCGPFLAKCGSSLGGGRFQCGLVNVLCQFFDLVFGIWVVILFLLMVHGNIICCCLHDFVLCFFIIVVVRGFCIIVRMKCWNSRLWKFQAISIPMVASTESARAGW